MASYCIDPVEDDRRLLSRSVHLVKGTMMVKARASMAAIAGTGILALGLVIVPPDANSMKIEVHAVQLSALTLPPATSPGNLLTKFVAAAAQTGDTTPPVVTPPLALRSAQDLTNNDAGSGQAAAALGEAPAPSVSGDPLLDAIFGIFSPYLALLNPGVLLLFGPVIVLVLLACPLCAIFNVVSGFIQSVINAFTPVPATALVATESVESKEIAAFSLSATPDVGATDTGVTELSEPESVGESSDARADANADEDLPPAPEAAEISDDSTMVIDVAAAEEEKATEATVGEEREESITDIAEAAEAEEASTTVTTDTVKSEEASGKEDVTAAAQSTVESSSTPTISTDATSKADDDSNGDSSESGGGDS